MKYDSWPKVQLQEVCEHITVGHVGPMVNQYTATGIPFLRSQNVRPFRFDPTEIKFISPQFHATLKKSALRPNDVVVTRSGANTGQCCVIPLQLADANCADLVILRPSERINPWFLMYVLNSDWGRATIAGGVVGAAQHHFNIGTARQFAIALPPIPVQRRIAGILSAYDELIENNQRRIKILEEMARSLYREWFVHFRFPGHEKVNMVSSPLGPIPQGWKFKPLGELATVTMGLSPKGNTYNEEENGTPLVNGPVEFGDRFTKRVKWTTEPTKFCKEGDLVVCVRGSTTGKYVKSDGLYCLGRGVCGISSKYQCFIELLFQNELPTLLGQTSGSTFPSWTGPQLKSYPVLSPSPEVLALFDEFVKPMGAAVLRYSRQIQNLRCTRDLLLPRLLSGDIEIQGMDSQSDKGQH